MKLEVLKVPSYEEIKIGDKASFTKTISESDVYQFAGITGDFNPVHINSEFANQTIFKERIVHGILTAGFISAVLGTQLPGSDTIYLSQKVDFKAPVKIGDTVTAEVEVLEKKDSKKIIRLRTIVKNQLEQIVIDGEAVVKK